MGSRLRPLFTSAVFLCGLWWCPMCSAQDVHFRATFEDGKTEGWTPGRAYIDGKPVGTLPEIKLAEAPDQPTYGGSRFALLLEDLVGTCCLLPRQVVVGVVRVHTAEAEPGGRVHLRVEARERDLQRLVGPRRRGR